MRERTTPNTTAPRAAPTSATKRWEAFIDDRHATVREHVPAGRPRDDGSSRSPPYRPRKAGRCAPARLGDAAEGLLDRREDRYESANARHRDGAVNDAAGIREDDRHALALRVRREEHAEDARVEERAFGQVDDQARPLRRTGDGVEEQTSRGEIVLPDEGDERGARIHAHLDRVEGILPLAVGSRHRQRSRVLGWASVSVAGARAMYPRLPVRVDRQRLSHATSAGQQPYRHVAASTSSRHENEHVSRAVAPVTGEKRLRRRASWPPNARFARRRRTSSRPRRVLGSSGRSPISPPTRGSRSDSRRPRGGH